MLAHFFYKVALPKTLPKEMEKEVEVLRKIRRKDLALQKAWDILLKKFDGSFSFENIQDYFPKNIHSLWQRKRQHCTSLNYFLRILLVKSGHVEEEDIQLKYSLISISPHQYLHVNTKGGGINMDPWSGTKGLKLGDYAWGFHWKS